MARTWRTERSTPKVKQQPKPRTKRVVVDPYCDAPVAFPMRACGCGQLVQCQCGPEAQGYLEADS